MKVVLFVLAISIAVVTAYPWMKSEKRAGKPCLPGYSPTQSGPEWEGQSATVKLQLLWANITANETEAGFQPNDVLAQIFTEDLNPTLDWVGDDFPGQCPFGDILGGDPAVQRPLTIHSLGAVAQVKYVPVETLNYTGVFLGSNYALARWSLAAAPFFTGPFIGIIPACVIKFLRDGQPSANLFGMYSLNTETNWSMFGHDLTNHLPALDPSQQANPLTSKIIYAFEKVSDYPLQLGINNLATYNEKGAPANNPEFPWRLILHPTSAMHSLFPSTIPQKSDQTNDYFVKQLKTLKAGTTVYELHAQPTPFSNNTILLGEIQLVTAPVSSSYGDRSLFFQHQSLEADLAIHPEWKDAANQIFKAQESVPDHNYVYPDLPFAEPPSGNTFPLK